MKVLLVATVQSHICQFHRPLVSMLHEHGCEVHVAARNNLAEKNGLKLDFVEQVFDVPFQRSPFSPKNLGAYKQLKKIIDEVDQLRSMMTRETWMVGQEAIDNGFADTLLTDEGPDVTLSADKKVQF